MKSCRKRIGSILNIVACAGLTACGGAGGGGAPTDQPPPPPPPAAVTESIDVAFVADDVIAGSSTTDTATATVRYNVTNSDVDITVTVNGMTADSISLRRAFAGGIGTEVHWLTQGSTAGTWELATTSLSATDVTDLEEGAWYLLITTAATPEGALRGQILPDGVSVGRFSLTAEQVTSGSLSPASARAWLTMDDNQSRVTIHIVTSGIEDAVSADLHTAKAGRDGPVAVTLAQDSASLASWSAEAINYTNELREMIQAGDLYAIVADPASSDGAIRGQYLPQGYELVATDLMADAVVMSSARFKTSAPAGRVMTTLGDGELTAHVNLFGTGDATAVELCQAPQGQNGPVLEEFAQNSESTGLWSLEAYPIDARARAGLDNRTLYVNVTTTPQPAGAARGQIETRASAPPQDPTSFNVLAVDPPNATKLEALPNTFFVTLNREPLPASVTPMAIETQASGGDGSFADGNEIPLVPATVSANGNTIEIGFGTVAVADDVYRITVAGGGDTGIIDMSGIALDGDGDGNPGGTFASAFEVSKPAVEATFTKIQNEVFSASCATSGCHTGSNPPDGLNLSAGQAYANIVNVVSVQMPSLMRIEPGNPDNSYLVRKVEGSGIVAGRMPLGSDRLSADQIELIRAWVSDGAPEN